MGASMEGSGRPSQVTRKRAREKASAWLSGTENSSARMVEAAADEGRCGEDHTGTVPLAGRSNLPEWAVAVEGARSLPARLMRSRTSLSGGVLPSHAAMGRESFVP